MIAAFCRPVRIIAETNICFSNSCTSDKDKCMAGVFVSFVVGNLDEWVSFRRLFCNVIITDGPKMACIFCINSSRNKSNVPKNARDDAMMASKDLFRLFLEFLLSRPFRLWSTTRVCRISLKIAGCTMSFANFSIEAQTLLMCVWCCDIVFTEYGICCWAAAWVVLPFNVRYGEGHSDTLFIFGLLLLRLLIWLSFTWFMNNAG